MAIKNFIMGELNSLRRSIDSVGRCEKDLGRNFKQKSNYKNFVNHQINHKSSDKSMHE